MWVLAVALHQAIGGAAVVEDLVGMQQPLLAEQVLVVSVVEEGRRFEVEWGQVVVAGAAPAGAVCLSLAREPTLDVALVVYTRSEHRAPRLTYRVCSCIAWIYFISLAYIYI